MYRVCCRGLRPCFWTIALLLTAQVVYRVLLVLEGQGTLARHGFNITIPKIQFGINRKASRATIPMDFFISEKSYCSDRAGMLAMALIPSKLEDFALRQETRQTWGSADTLGVPFGMVFLLGRPTNRKQREEIKDERREYGDIVQGDYDDQDQASKTLNGLYWLALNCAMVPFTIIASDKVLLDVFLLQSFLWEVLEVPEKQSMIFGKLMIYRPPSEKPSSGWSLKGLVNFVPQVTEAPIENYTPYFEEGAWFGRTQTVAKLLGASGGVPLVSPTSMYFTGLLASAAGLYRSPEVFNAWWRTDTKVRFEEIGLVLGWLNKDLVPSRVRLWELLKKHHEVSYDKLENQMVRREIKPIEKPASKKQPVTQSLQVNVTHAEKKTRGNIIKIAKIKGKTQTNLTHVEKKTTSHIKTTKIKSNATQADKKASGNMKTIKIKGNVKHSEKKAVSNILKNATIKGKSHKKAGNVGKKKNETLPTKGKYFTKKFKGMTKRTFNSSDPRKQKTFLFRKKQLDQMMKTTGIKINL
uniref:Beta-1,3-galactosyltransferase bre-5-like n=2 Tax=Hirondellea gigas TaxID=1518452 RepID=A0A2P2HWV3_9CRUS